MHIILSPGLEALADRLFDFWDEQPRSDPLKPECVVIQNRIAEAWLRHRFVLDRLDHAGQRVRANWDVQFLNVFVNDWLHRMEAGAEDDREPDSHPYSTSSLQWRLYRLFGPDIGGEKRLKPLAAYLGEGAPPWRRFGLASTMASLFDTYEVHRLRMLLEWEKQGDGLASENSENPKTWQSFLWRRLAEENEGSYLKSFVSMASKLPSCCIHERYERVTVFGVSTMPPVYLDFFSILSSVIPVSLYLLDPRCNCVGARKAGGSKGGEAFALEGLPEEETSSCNPLVAALSRAHASCLDEACRRAAEPPVRITKPKTGACSLLQVVRNDILADLPLDSAEEPKKAPARQEGKAADDSIRIHICHSPLRELEVLRDHLLRWFSEDPTMEPRHVQVLVTDMATYLPYIEAVFGTENPAEAQAIPYAVADRFVLATNGAARAFVSLLALPASRFKASEVIDLLACDAVRERFGIETEDLASLRDLVTAAGIRWGLDAPHRTEVSAATFKAATSWRHGLDRLLLGYALGDQTGKSGAELVSSGKLGDILPETSASGEDAALLGVLARFLERLEWAKGLLGGRDEKAGLRQWSERLLLILDAFFVNTNEAFADLYSIRGEITGLGKKAEIPGLRLDGMQVEFEAVATYLTSRLESAEAADALLGNEVIFSGLRLGAAMPRRAICVLGLGDGIFPRGDARPAFDMLAHEGARRNCDPSLRLSDRGAFLEVLLAARDRLYLSYVGRGDRENEVVPPSTVISELKGYLRTRFNLPPPIKAWDGKTDLESFETLHHLQAFHPDYFEGKDNRLFSCSMENLEGARALLREKRHPAPRGIGKEQQSDSSSAITVDELCYFFDNPAKAYFTETLKVRFDEDTETVMADEEMFEADHLELYKLGQPIIDAMLSGGDREHMLPALAEKFRQRGMLPLGNPGLAVLAQKWEELNDFLDCDMPGQRGKLHDLMKKEKQRVSISLDLASGVKIAGRIDVLDLGGEMVQLAARHAGLKAKDQLRAWIRHLVLAAQRMSVSTLVVPKGPKEIMTYTAMDADTAKRLLLQLASLVKKGKSRPLPFAPETSWAFFAANIAPTNQEGFEKAVNAAAAKWAGSDDVPGESRDRYLYRAFGESGPMSVAGFVECAGQVFENLPLPERKSGGKTDDPKSEPVKKGAESESPAVPQDTSAKHGLVKKVVKPSKSPYGRVKGETA